MFYLKSNLPSWERILRLAGSAVLAVIACLSTLPSSYNLALAGMAAMLGLTALAGFCPACALVGRRPAREDK